ncbi:ATP-binding protein [Streptomyces sp. NBC_00564]|uniref:ATP-binding protein n=1 Tax=Streptomyces sp. NBC_00564 TaxID=2903663 RepID=UPI00352D655F|nr:ATP-binding protein [Streptomyces sp. NBC_00564]
METKLVRADRDTILGYVERASPVDVLAELIWNALDAEAMNIETTVAIGAMGVPEEIVVRDDGHGMPHDQVPDLLLTHGESWKRASGFSPNINRPMHGQLGRGRFLAYSIAERVEWRSAAANGDALTETVIHGNRSTPNAFNFDGPWPSTGPTGTTVRMATRQTSRVASLADGDVHLPLTARLAAALLALPEVKVHYRGQPLTPQAHITHDVNLDLDLDPAMLHGKYQPWLRVVEWSVDMRSKALYLCDERGGVVTEHKLGRMPPAPIHWTAYLQWEGFRDPDLMGPADLHVPDIRHGELLAVANRALVDYLNRRLDEQKGSILAEWKAEGVYPYQGEPRSAAEEVEREIFDIVAVVASPAIGRDVKQKKLSLRLLQEATRAEPSRTNRILNAVLDLTDDEQQVLLDLLERTRLAAIVQAAQTIANRSDFLHGLRGLLYADDTKTVFREVDQLHPMLVNEPWIFGDEWSLALSETGLTRVVRTLITQRDDVEFASNPVTLPSGKRGRVDMVFSRHLPESERTRHLVVELKRPMRLTMTEFGQINNYASAITGHPEVLGTPHDWDFWLVGTEIDDVVRNQYSDSARPGLTTNNPRYRIWVMTWGQLLDQAERRVQAFRSALELVSTDQTSRDYLQRKHAEFIPPSSPRGDA